MGALLIIIILYCMVPLFHKETKRDYSYYYSDYYINIKYDIKDRNVLFVFMLITIIIFSFCKVSQYMHDDNIIISGLISLWDFIIRINTFWQFILLYGVIIFTGLFIDSCIYIKKLKAFGYEVPENKKVYAGNLLYLPRDGNNHELTKYEKGKTILLSLCLIYGILILVIYVFWSNISLSNDYLFLGLLCSGFYLIMFFKIKNKEYSFFFTELNMNDTNSKKYESFILNLIFITFIFILFICFTFFIKDYILQDYSYMLSDDF